jgi:hypothetical protein
VGNMLTKEEVERALPTNIRGPIVETITDALNNIQETPEVAQQIRDNFIGYTAVLKDGRFKTEDYLHAVAYVSFKVMGYTSREAYERTFPDRITDLLSRGTSTKDIAAYVAAYNRGKLVNLILEQTLVPTWVLNQDLYQEAINTQADLMRTAYSEKVRTDAANSLLTHLKKPDTKDFQISLDVKESSGMTELKSALRDMAQKQSELLQAGVTTAQIAAQPIVDGGTLRNEANDLTEEDA